MRCSAPKRIGAWLLWFGVFNSPQRLSSVAATLWDSLEACSAELITISLPCSYAGKSYHIMCRVVFAYGFTLCLT